MNSMPSVPAASTNGYCWLPEVGELTIYRGVRNLPTPAHVIGKNRNDEFRVPLAYRPIGVPGLQVAAGALRSLWEVDRKTFGDRNAWEILSQLSRIELCAITRDHHWGITERGRRLVERLGGPAPRCVWPRGRMLTEQELEGFGFVVMPVTAFPLEGHGRRPARFGERSNGLTTDAHYTRVQRVKRKKASE